MRTAADRKTINNFLGNRGFATLDDPGAMLRQFAFTVRDHDHFRKLLSACEPESRRSMYDSLTPHLQFAAKPLDVYMADAALDAEIRQLPTIGDDGGNLKPFRVSELNSDEYRLQQITLRELAQHHLTVTCSKCTAQETFHGGRKADAIQALRNAGWTYDEISGTGREICPKCPGGKVN